MSAALLAALKAAAGGGGPELVIPCGSPPRSFLRPVGTVAGRIRESDVAALTEWRNRHATAFLTEFEATPERTLEWLSRVVAADPGKILFMVDDLAGRTFGYMGLDAIDWESSYGEADAIVRGAEAPRGAMTEALVTLLDWARAGLGLNDLAVRVLSDNPALAFYAKLGFVERRRVPLRRIVEPGIARWVEDPGAAGAPRELVHMSWTGNSGGAPR